MQIFTPDPLTFECRTKGHRDIDLCNMNLESPYFHGSLTDLIMAYIGNHMFVGTDTGGQNLGNIRISKGRETPVDAAGCCTCPSGSDFAKGVYKGKDPVFVIQKNLFIVTGLDPAKGHGCPVGKT